MRTKKKWLVVWELDDIEAGTPLEAAKKAFKAQRSSKPVALVFGVARSRKDNVPVYEVDIHKPGTCRKLVLMGDTRSTLLALSKLVSTIEATGGVVSDSRGVGYSPAADEHWCDLGDAYVSACRALGWKPVVTEGEEEDGDG